MEMDMTAVIITMADQARRRITKTFRVNGYRTANQQANDYQHRQEARGNVLVKRIEIPQ